MNPDPKPQPPPKPIPSVRKIHFNALSEVARQRFIDTISRKRGPNPIFEERLGLGGAIAGWGLLALLAGAGIGGGVLYEVGSIYRFHQEAYFILAYLLGIFLLLYSALAIVRRVTLRRQLPFEPGRYLFPTDLVDAREAKLKIYPLAKLASINGVHHHRNGIYQYTAIHFRFVDAGTHTFTVHGKARAESLLNQIDADRARMRNAIMAFDMETIKQMDLFYEARGEEVWDDPAIADRLEKEAQWTQGGPRAGDLPIFLKWASVIAVVPAILLCLPLWFVRNLVSDEMAYREIRSRDADSAIYAANSYVRNGGRQADRVRNEVLPRLASDRFMQQANTNDTQMVAFMTELLTWLVQHDSPSVQVRFNPPSLESLAMTDQFLSSQGQQLNGRPVAPIAPHFTGDRSETRERDVTRSLQEGFEAVLPSSIMNLEHSGRMATPNMPVDPNHPAIDVSYLIRPSGTTYSSSTSARDFVGIHLDFTVTMRIPGSAQTYSFPLAVEPPEHFTVRRYPGDSQDDGAVYHVMAERAFDHLSARMATVFFAPGSRAYQRATGQSPY